MSLIHCSIRLVSGFLNAERYDRLKSLTNLFLDSHLCSRCFFSLNLRDRCIVYEQVNKGNNKIMEIPNNLPKGKSKLISI